MSRLWPAGTFVDFNRGLNKAINHLREALGDSAEQPHFIENFSRKGYRFILHRLHMTANHRRKLNLRAGLARGSRGARTWTVGLAAAIACLGLVIGLTVGRSRHWMAARWQDAPQISALAVIPLENLSGDPEQEYFADGMTNELITGLAKWQSQGDVAGLGHSLQGTRRVSRRSGGNSAWTP